VAGREGKTRGAITNLFGSQAAFQTETMGLALSAADWIERIDFPPPEDFPTAEAWLDALLAEESDRGPLHDSEPTVSYGTLWALWLSAVPYALWSEEVPRLSLGEHRLWIGRLEHELRRALEHFGLELRRETTVNDLASAFATLVEGAWLTQCQTTRHPTDASEPVATLLRRSGRLLWSGAIEP
jgi:hypothetical protein